MLGQDVGVALGGIGGVGGQQFVGVYLGFGSVHATSGFEPRHCSNIGWVNQPIARGHRGAVVQQRCIAHYARVAVGVAQHHGEVALRATPQQCGDLLDIERSC